MSQSYRGRSTSSNGTARRSKGGPKIFVLIVVLVLLVGAGAGIIALINPGGAQTAGPGATATSGNGSGDIPAGEIYYEGIAVDGIPVGGLTREQAKQKVEDKQKEYAQTAGVTVTKDGTSVLLKLEETTYAFDTDAVLDEAWKLGREGTGEERRALIEELKTTPRSFTTKLTSVDPSALESKVKELTTPYYKAPVDATFQGFDITKPAEERLSFAPEVAGEQVNADALWAAVKQEFESLKLGSVAMQAEPLPATVTLASLKAELQLLQLANIPAYEGASSSVRKTINEANKGHTFTTRIKNSKEPRMTNIKLAGDSVSGLLLPGEIFDFNVRTGIRSYERGYKDAPVDIAGTEDLGIGGGVCQVSSTLYNAAIRCGGKYEADGKASTADRPGLAIIERDNHSVPSGYVMRGMDATVDMQLPSGKSNKNLKFRNDFDKPILIVMYYEKIGSYWYEHCDIYGPPIMENGIPVTYDFVGKNYKKLEVDPLTPPITRYSKHATPNKPVLKPGGNGFTIDMYVVKTVQGKDPVSTKIYSDKCDPQPPYWYVFTGEAVPTPTPSLTPTPEATPAPTHAPTHTPAPATEPPATEPPATETAAAG